MGGVASGALLPIEATGTEQHPGALGASVGAILERLREATLQRDVASAICGRVVVAAYRLAICLGLPLTSYLALSFQCIYDAKANTLKSN